MNAYHELWWEQARSDHTALILLRRHGADPCHQLHYLQMVTEKLGKAYFCRSGAPPVKSHAVFVRFMRALGSIQKSKRYRIANILNFKSFHGLQSWVTSALPLVYDLERLAPALAQGGPNPEYPWPQDAPTECPAKFRFPLWSRLTNTGPGRELTKVILAAVDRFPEYA